MFSIRKISKLINECKNKNDFPDRDVIKFFKLIKIEPEKGCWFIREDWSVYTSITVGGKNILAHRFSYWLFKERPKRLVCHTCDRPGCVNPDHLFEGSNFDNFHDAVKKKRAYIGKLNSTTHWTRLKEKDNWKKLNRFCK